MSTAYDPASDQPASDDTEETDRRAGDLTIAARVIEKIAGRAVLEVGPAIGERRSVLGVSIPGSSTVATPQVSADVFGRDAVVRVRCGVIYPEPVPAVTQRIRQHVRQKVHDLTGIRVHEVDVDVVALRRPASAGRVE